MEAGKEGSIEEGKEREGSSHPQTPPSHEEKRSGEPSRISWASVRFCDNVT